MPKMCDCNQGRMDCRCRDEFLSISPVEAALLRIHQKAKKHIGAKSEQERKRMTRQWRSRLFYHYYCLFPKITFWDEGMRLQNELDRIKIKAEIYRSKNPKTAARFGPTLHKLMPDILVKNHVFKLMCVELGGWK